MCSLIFSIELEASFWGFSMLSQYKKIIKDLIPPICARIYTRKMSMYGWFGDYISWEDARSKCTSYDTPEILQRVKDALLKVKKSEAVYERDSVLFDKIEYSFPLLSGLMWIAANDAGKLNVVDFGGSLGSTYYQNRLFLSTLKEVHWNVVEQRHFVECGKIYLADESLHFYDSLQNCLKEQSPDTVLLSSVIQYIEKPYELLRDIIDIGFKYIIVDRTPFVDSNRDRLTVQKVPPNIYNASYPCWLFHERTFLDYFSNHYQLIVDFEAHQGIIIYLKDTTARYRGFIFKATT
jgi:putative methyltransferase (TIGR04325 family)